MWVVCGGSYAVYGLKDNGGGSSSSSKSLQTRRRLAQIQRSNEHSKKYLQTKRDIQTMSDIPSTMMASSFAWEIMCVHLQ